MALNTYPDIRCYNSAHMQRRPMTDADWPPAVAVVYEADYECAGWHARCEPCIQELRKVGNITHDVAYLDPTRFPRHVRLVR